jgi:hypothetical protein
MTFLATASGLMIESVRSMAMLRFLSFILKIGIGNLDFQIWLHSGKPAILTRH